MKITFWGARGSIPVSGRQYLKYGGDATCIEIRTAGNKIIIIDSGGSLTAVEIEGTTVDSDSAGVL